MVFSYLGEPGSSFFQMVWNFIHQFFMLTKWNGSEVGLSIRDGWQLEVMPNGLWLVSVLITCPKATFWITDLLLVWGMCRDYLFLLLFLLSEWVQYLYWLWVSQSWIFGSFCSWSWVCIDVNVIKRQPISCFIWQVCDGGLLCFCCLSNQNMWVSTTYLQASLFP